jgi:hypothetical protein
VATKEQIYEWIRYTCPTDTDAEQVAEIVATKLAEENGSSYNKQSVQCQHSFYAVRCANIVRCNKCGTEFPLISTC